MTEYAHNHPPHCCCPAFLAGTRTPVEVCPLCPEHGVLAQLGNTANAEYPCCHQLAGRPHTDYCPTVRGPHHNRGEAMPTGRERPGEHWNARIIREEAEAANDPWHAPLTGIEVRNPLGMTYEPTHHTHSADPNGVHPRTEWATQTSQPPTQTSQLPSQARIAGEGPTPAEAARPTPGTEDLVGRLRDAVDQAKARRQADQVTEDNKGQRWHETGPHEAHETWRCSPPKCGRERAPLGTPTPCPCTYSVGVTNHQWGCIEWTPDTP